MDADLVIVGGGFAGLGTACRAVELGLKPVVLEQGKDADYLCNSRYSGGAVVIGMENPMQDPAFLFENFQRNTGGYTDPDVARAFTGDGPKLLDWLRNNGVQFMRQGAISHLQWIMTPPRPAKPGTNWQGRGPDLLLRRLAKRVVDHGGQILLDTKAKSLVMENGTCRGVIATQAGAEVTTRAKAVVLADGGFQANETLLAKYINPRTDRIMQRNARSGVGDGIRMAEAAGARLAGTEFFYGHPLSRDALTNDLLWPYPFLDSVVTTGIVVDADARRFVDEGLGAIYIANIMARRDDPSDSFAVFDDAIWNGPAADIRNHFPPNPNVKNLGGTLHTARMIPELARLCGLPADALMDSISRHNEAIAQKKTDSLSPPRSVHRVPPMPIVKPPFHAMPMCPGITYTMGGPAIDRNCRVMHTSGLPIQNLYAVGSGSGGLEGGPPVGYFGGVAKAFISALRAAEHIAEESRRG
ncbi:MAG: FAD-dependent oxidoreductase [Betaproteobacteria bacterium]|nr:FAD-dependent oxidoreductase [Betaproteobacteria bacterium]